ncbi:MAG TPA: hypothetical protein VMQ73_08485 [Methylomirabilota bacterium]|nr:hypothetical protein [Methylomirabilota bacterium]
MADARQPSEPGRQRPRVAVVVGPGRSGTSALTGALRALSVDLGNNLKPALRKNAKGFFEDRDLLSVNHRLHRVLGLRATGTSVGPIEPQRWNDPVLSDLRQEAVQVIRDRFGSAPLWGFKCGGMIRVLPFWEDVLSELGLDIFYLVAIRNPLNMASSRAILDTYRGAQEKSDAEWLSQIVPYFQRILARPFIAVDYDHMVGDPTHELSRIARLLRIEVTPALEQQIRDYAAGFITPGLRHHRATLDELARDPNVNTLTRDAYGWLLRLASDSVDPQSPEFRADWQRIERSFTEMGPLLRHIDYLEDRLRRRGPTLKSVWGTVLQHLPVAATLIGGEPSRRPRMRRATQDS